MKNGAWFPLHGKKKIDDGLIRPSGNAVCILGRKVLTFRKDAASIQASDTVPSDFSVSTDGSLASKAQQIKH